MALGRRESSHDTQLSRLHAAEGPEHALAPGQRVMTCDGIAGVVQGIDYQPLMGAELYDVLLDAGAGGGQYSSSQLTPMAGRIASGVHLASEDYPELSQILQDRPDIALPMKMGSLQATAGFRTEEEPGYDMGGTKFGPKRTLHAHDEDTGEHAGTLEYFQPKRKGSPAQVDSLYTSKPGAGSHLLNQMEQDHPGSRTVFLNEEKRGNNTPQHGGNGKHGQPTDWDEHYGGVEGVHRGFSARLPSYDAKTVNSPESEPHEHVQALRKVIDSSSAGMHWSAREQNARNFAQKGRMDHRTDIPVVLHGERPERKDIETRPSELFRNGVFPHDHTEAEVPVRKGRKVKITGMSWKPDTMHPDADENGWMHHTFPEPIHKSAAEEDGGTEEAWFVHEATVPSEAHTGRTAALDPYTEADMFGVQEDHHVAGRGKPRADGRGAGGGAEAQDQLGGGKPSVGPREEHAGPRVIGAAPVGFHPAAAKDLKKLDHQSRNQVMAVIDALEQGQPTQTHLLRHPLKGWMGTKASRGHRVVHRKEADGSHFIGHIGLHDYEAAERRLASQMDGGYEDLGDPANEDGTVNDGLVSAACSDAEAMAGSHGHYDDGSEWAEDGYPVDGRHKAAFNPYTALTEAAFDPEFRFHFTAAWSDVRAKAKRIRAEGGVRITLASDGLVIGEVKGDHHVYETGVQRFPGSRNSIATYSCGCKWGAYHWGASDDFSRFAGRMCSHALALQFEAQSKGMFGRDIVPETRKPEWVPRKVVVKYDIDDGDNQFGKSSSLEETPLLALARWAAVQGDDVQEFNLALTASGIAVTAAVNSPFGDPQPQPMQYQPGPTKPRNPSDNPASSGWATQGDPDSWDSISPNELGGRVGHLEEELAFEAAIPQEVAQSGSPQGLQGEDSPDGWDSIAPTAVRATATVDLSAMAAELLRIAAQPGPPRPSGPKGGSGGEMPPGHPGMPQHQELTEATLHMEPEGALPFTDGDSGVDLSDDESLTPPHTASRSVEDLQAMLGHLNPAGGGTAVTAADATAHVPEGDIAAAARQHLAKVAVKDYSAAEQAAIINEGRGVQAANLHRLDIKDTHYSHLNDDEDESWLN